MTDEIKCGGEVFKSFAIRNATYEDCAAVLECLRSAFAPYRESYTPEAFLDTVSTPETFRHRLSEMSVFVGTGTSGEIAGTIACKVLEGGEGHLRRMAVHPEWQGSGVSTCLLERAEDDSARRDAGPLLSTPPSR
jgi:N-acetylglutamate synthase-like GNAT family acetyltransferase